MNEKQEKIKSTVKTVSIIIAVFSVLFFLFMSRKLYDFKVENEVEYFVRYKKLNNYEQALATSMEKTGEVEAKIAPGRKKGSYSIFDDISNSHKRK